MFSEGEARFLINVLKEVKVSARKRAVGLLDATKKSAPPLHISQTLAHLRENSGFCDSCIEKIKNPPSNS